MTEILSALLLNPNSGGGIEEAALRALEDAVSRHEGRLIVTQSSQEAQSFITRAAEKGYTRVIASGGDDTVRDLLPALLSTPCDLAILPRGTYNNFALALGIPTDEQRALELALTGTARLVDLGHAEGLTFTESAGVGYLAEAWSRAPQPEPTGFRRWAGGFAAAGSALLDYQPLRLKVRLDQEEFEGDFWDITVANAPYFANNIAIAPQASLSDGKLDVTLWPKASAFEFLAALPALLSEQGPGQLPQVRTVQARRIEVRSDHEIPLRVDNTVLQGNRFVFECLPGALRVVTPGRRTPL